ncbi:MAG: VCBS repeat-containing protein [Chloracidobacterium sp.]|nr:VCBS repeat-containing protein [Chloracidobacterium sp.]
MLKKYASSNFRRIVVIIIAAVAVSLYLINAAGSDAAAFSFVSDDGRKLSPAPEITCAPPPTGLVSWWPGDDDTNDQTGSNHGVIVNGATYVAGKVGRAFDFGGNTDYVQVAAPTGLPLSNAPRTMMMWFKTPTTWGDTHQVIMQYGGNAQGSKFGLFTPNYYNRALSFWGESADLAGATPLQNDTWYHGTVTYDGNVITLFLNGQLEASHSFGLNTQLNAGGFIIGRTGPDNITSEWNGSVDEAMMFDRVLTQTEIQAIYDAGSAGACRSCTPQAADIISRWGAENNSLDAIGLNNAVLNGNTNFVSGKVGNAFNLDGSGDFVQVAVPNGLPLGNDARTMELWFRTPIDLSVSTEAGIIQYGTASTGSMFGLITSGNAPGKLYFYGHSADLAGTTTILPNTWYHAAVTFDGTTLKLYLNGQLENQAAMTLNTVLESHGLSMGYRIGGAYWNGQIDEPAIYGRALTDTEIRSIYDSGNAGKCSACSPAPTGLVSWWRGSNNAIDIISGNNGTLLGGAGYADGKVGRAFSFNGTTATVDVPDNNSLDVTTEFSLASWVKPEVIPTYPNGALVMSKVGPISNLNGYQLTLTNIEGVNKIWCGFNTGGGWPQYTATGGSVPIGAWTHVACSYDHDTLRVLQDGQVVGSTPIGPVTVINTSSNLKLGSDDVGMQFYKGLIDEAMVFNRALTTPEIAEIFNTGSTGVCIPNLGRAYVPNSGDATTSVIDIATSSVVATLTNSAMPQQSFVTVSDDGSRLYIPQVSSGNISVFDTANDSLINTLTVPGTVHGVAVNPAGTRIYVTERDGSNVRVLDTTTGAILATIPVGSNPFAIAAAPDGRHVYVGNYGGTVSAIDTFDNSVFTIPVGGIAYGVAVSPDSSRVYVSVMSANNIAVIDAGSNAIIATISHPTPRVIAVNAAGTRAYVAGGSTDVLQIDTATNQGTLIPVGRSTEGISVSADSTRILAAAATSNTVVSINAVTHSVIDIPVGSSPYAMGTFIAQHIGAAAATPGCAARPTGMNAWWRAQSNALDRLKLDHGTLLNAGGYSVGKVGQSFNFQGVSNSGVTIPHSTQLGVNSTGFTSEFWMKSNGAQPESLSSIIDKSHGFADSTGWVFTAFSGEGGVVHFAIGRGGAGTSDFAEVVSIANALDGNYHHIAGVWDGASMALYVDGSFQGSTPMTTPANNTRPLNLGFAWGGGSPTRYFNGKIDDPAIYRRALAANEIKAIYQAGNLGKCVGTQTMADMDGDMWSDLAIFRPNGANGAEWWWLKSTGGNGAVQFGAAADTIVTADYTGDGKTDIAFWQPSTGFWYVLRSEDVTYYAFPFGASGDIPTPADFDGDGKADPTVFRASNTTWYISRSTGGTGITQFGAVGDKPVIEDYDGDGKADIAVFRPNGTGGAEWWIMQSSGGVFATQFGRPTDRAVPADYTGDGRADIAFWDPATGYWFILRSDDYSYYAFPFGAAGDLPIPADYDGDAKADAGVYRPATSNWFISRSRDGLLIQQFGSVGDVPVPNAFVR